MNNWPGGHRHAMEQSEHERWNATRYPGTRQMCSVCEEPTERCEEDAILSDDGEPLCVNCYRSTLTEVVTEDKLKLEIEKLRTLLLGVLENDESAEEFNNSNLDPEFKRQIREAITWKIN